MAFKEIDIKIMVCVGMICVSVFVIKWALEFTKNKTNDTKY